MHDPLAKVLSGNAVIARLPKPFSRFQITRVVTRKRKEDFPMSTYSPFVMGAIWLFERRPGSEGSL